MAALPLQENIPAMTAQELKEQLADQPIGQYSANKYVPYIQVATVNARQADEAPDENKPAPMQTKVYRLAEALLVILKK